MPWDDTDVRPPGAGRTGTRRAPIPSEWRRPDSPDLETGGTRSTPTAAPVRESTGTARELARREAANAFRSYPAPETAAREGARLSSFQETRRERTCGFRQARAPRPARESAARLRPRFWVRKAAPGRACVSRGAR